MGLRCKISHTTLADANESQDWRIFADFAGKTQIWIAVSVYVPVAIVRKRLKLGASLYQILQILSATRFEKTPILQALQAHDFQFRFTRSR